MRFTGIDQWPGALIRWPSTTRFRLRSDLSFVVLAALFAVVALAGCHELPNGDGGTSHRRLPRPGKGPVRDMACIYDQKPWLNLDEAGDRNPEGIQFRVFLDPGSGKGVLRKGTLHVKMYRISRTSEGRLDRTLVSDWHYPMSRFSPIKSTFLGMGYAVRLRWANKDMAGHEVEVITRYEDPHGNVVSAGTKRLHVPKYAF